jgi:hypothetical protein
MFVYYNYTLYIYLTKQTNNISPLKTQHYDNFRINRAESRSSITSYQ